MQTSSLRSLSRVPRLPRGNRVLAALFVRGLLLSLASVVSAQTPTTAPVISPSTDVLISPGAPFVYSIRASGSPTSYSASGLPSGLMCDAATGIISGVTGVTGTFNVTLRATNAGGTATATQVMRAEGVTPIEMPYVRSATPPPSNLYRVGDTLTIVVELDAPYGGVVVSGTPRIALHLATEVRYATYRSTDNPTSTRPRLSFSYDVVPGDQAADGVTCDSVIEQNGGTIRDRAGLYCALALPNLTASGVRVVTSAVSTPPSGSSAVVIAAASRQDSPSPSMVNLSSRLSVVGGDPSRSLIAGFVVAGTTARPMLMRAVGPALKRFGVAAPLTNPKLTVFDSAGRRVSENDDWNNDANVLATTERVGAFPLAKDGGDAAILATLPPGAYSAVVTGEGEGTALVEIYDAAAGSPDSGQHLVNLATRGFIGGSEGSLVGGFVVSGDRGKRLLIRGVGPSLGTFGVNDAVADPMLRLYQNGKVIAQNDDWSEQTAATTGEVAAATVASGAFPLRAGSKDAALLVTLLPGAYSAIVTSTGNTTGAALVEVYEVLGL